VSATGLPATLHPEASSFLAAAGEILMRNEVLNGLSAGILLTLIEQPDRYGTQPFLCTIAGRSGGMAAAAIQTPPHNVILCAGFDWPSEAMDAVIDAALAGGWKLPGVIGPSGPAGLFASRYGDRFRIGSTINMELGLYVLREVEPVPQAGGSLRRAETSDLSFIHNWFEGFYLDCFGGIPDYAGRAATERIVSSGDLFIWVDGEPVSMAGTSRPTWHGVTVNMVYTPPELRCRGYARSCVAQLSRLLLQSGWQFCTLFTDLANPTSNSIYSKIGYRREGTFTEIRFEG
jgi:uncharacterized protein